MESLESDLGASGEADGESAWRDVESRLGDFALDGVYVAEVEGPDFAP